MGLDRRGVGFEQRAPGEPSGFHPLDAAPTPVTRQNRAGEAGPAGGTAYFAIVSQLGTLGQHGDGVTNAIHGGAVGVYLVLTDTDLTECSILVSRQGGSGGEISWKDGINSSHEVYVLTFDYAGNPEDASFSFAAFC